jgi:NADPH:quinone reductase-like Zn-dependent oxidoreductase
MRRLAIDEVVVEIRRLGPGAGFAGIVVERGGVPGLDVGEAVFGTASAGAPRAARLVCREGALARKPVALADAEAAALAEAGPIALRALRAGGTTAADRVLVTGAGGEVGALAVQIARVRGHHVTAVCRERDVPLAWDLGADEVHAEERGASASWTGGGRFRAVIDTDESLTPEVAQRLLVADGRLIAIREGALHVSTARGEPLVVEEHAAPGLVDLGELVDLVERAGVFPVTR